MDLATISYRMEDEPIITEALCSAEITMFCPPLPGMRLFKWLEEVRPFLDGPDGYEKVEWEFGQADGAWFLKLFGTPSTGLEDEEGEEDSDG